MKRRKRAERRAHAKRVAAARRALVMAQGSAEYYEHLSDNAIAVRHPLDCGKRCFMCHGEKMLGSGTRRQQWKRHAAFEIIHSS